MKGDIFRELSGLTHSFKFYFNFPKSLLLTIPAITDFLHHLEEAISNIIHSKFI